MIRLLTTGWHRQGSCLHVRSALRSLSYALDASSTPCVPVVIVGAGPTGLVLSSLLSQYGEGSRAAEATKQDKEFNSSTACLCV